MIRTLSRLFSAFWPLGLFVFFLVLVLSFSTIPEQIIAQIFGAAVIFCAALAWLIVDWVKPTQKRINDSLADLADLLKPYEGMSLKQMPPDVRAEVYRRLGWTLKDSPTSDKPTDQKEKVS